MKKGRYEREEPKRAPMGLIILIILLVCAFVLVGIWFMGPFGNDDPITLPPATTINVADEKVSVDFQTGPANITDSEEPTEYETQESTVEPETQEQIPLETIGTVQRTDAEYEKWLAAAMIICVSMEYPDFEPEGVYAASSTAMEDKFDSEGVYIAFTSGGERIVIHSKALEGERSATGTTDISSEAIGFASFDRVDPSSVDFSAMVEFVLDDMNDLISKSILVTIYSH